MPDRLEQLFPKSNRATVDAARVVSHGGDSLHGNQVTREDARYFIRQHAELIKFLYVQETKKRSTT